MDGVSIDLTPAQEVEMSWTPHAAVWESELAGMEVEETTASWVAGLDDEMDDGMDDEMMEGTDDHLDWTMPGFGSEGLAIHSGEDEIDENPDVILPNESTS